ncbi:uncharacterized protein LOC103860304 [Brassica rapa]|uniref:Uncharacterized protein n=2 Tax=Brassica TaxID=3705 RepID=M4D9P5_BRACM|nr:uncharacterized protein LOC103860304 [Brassica rapa]XP_048632568.1 uncharacterized protein LOC106361825 [Brassica napus]CAF2128793.1 unnamed protein product [Brassica napus]
MTEFQKQERGVKKMKIVAKIIALASIFSLLLSYSSLVSSLQQSLHLLSMYISLVDKKYMFLLCNGIVGFIMGNFKTLLHGSTAMNIVEETEELRINHMRKSEMKRVVALLGEQRVSKKEEGEVVALLGEQRVSKGEVVALVGEQCVSKEEDGEERVDLFREEEVTIVFEDDNGGKDLTVITIDEHDDDEINDNLLSSEDLNKKCEEFIRRMKAGIRSESRTLLTS